MKAVRSDERETEQTLIKTMTLDNGLKLEVYDISRKLAGDRWYVGMVAQIDIPLTDSLLANQPLSNYPAAEIKNAMGAVVRFQQKRERHYIDEREKDALRHSLTESFIKNTLTYFSRPDFPAKYVFKAFQACLKRQTWYPDDRRG